MNKAEIASEIKEFEALLNEPSVPQDEKQFAKEEIARLKQELESFKDVAQKPKKKPVASQSDSKITVIPKSSEDPDCDDLLDQYKKRKKTQKISAAKASKTPTIKKDKAAVEKTVDRIEKHYKEGDLSESQIKELILELESKLKELKAMLENKKSSNQSNLDVDKKKLTPYLGFFDKQKHGFYAENLSSAKAMAIAHFKPAKSKQHLVHVHVAEDTEVQKFCGGGMVKSGWKTDRSYRMQS